MANNYYAVTHPSIGNYFMLTTGEVITNTDEKLTFAENQPNMQAALEHMSQARQELERAEHDEGGHRVKALQHLKAAMQETPAGINFDNAHTDKSEKLKMKNIPHP